MSELESTDSPDRPTQPMPEVLLDRAGTLVIDKPAGVSSQMRVDTEGVSIIERVRRNGFPRAELPHRLDRMTGGVLVVATDLDALRFHNESIRDGLWTKIYVARVTRPLYCHKLLGKKRLYMRRKGRKAHVVKSGGKVARMEILALADVPGSHEQIDVVIDLGTGRYHQIRAGLASMKAPLVGDLTYGGVEGIQPLLTHVMMRLPLPDGSWHLLRTEVADAAIETDDELVSFLDELESQLAPPSRTSHE
ncbi:MAG: pseudouridine synthase [Planctomycetota bacterium]|nr:pseudouridine synthase [Planctomycetota bacterium]